MHTETRREPARRPVRDSLHFLGRFLRAPGSVGAIAPSSRYLAELMLENTAVKPGDLILEYGPGTGPMTKSLLPLIQRGARYLGIELDPTFHRTLQQRFGNLEFHHGDVGEIGAILAERGLGPVRLIVSGLPFASFPETVQTRILDGIENVLQPDGEFRTFQYVHAYGLPAARRFRAMMRERFSNFERSRAVMRNVPPAFVLRYRR